MKARFGHLVLISFLISGCALQRGRARRFFHYASYLSAGPAPEADCRQTEVIRYCFHKPPKGTIEDPDAVLYFLHPADGSEKDWVKYPISRVYYQRFRKRDVPAPQVVTLSYGPYWTLMNEPGEKQPALFETFVSSWMALIEEETGAPRRRYIWGMSQGGLNAAELILKRPDLFAGAVISCPAFYSFPLYSKDDVIKRYIKRTGADAGSVNWGLAILRPRVGGPEAWAEEDPLALAAKARRIPPTLIQANTGDDYGFYEGASRFYDALHDSDLPVTFASSPGAHCVVDAPQAVDFLIALTPPR